MAIDKETKKSGFNSYVGSFYNKLDKNLNTSYSDWKWFRTKSAISQYNQTKKSILKIIYKKKYNRALEIGPGDGIWTQLLSRNCLKIDAIDISKEMLAMAKKRLKKIKKVNFIEGDFLNIPLKKESYDIIYSIRCIEYIDDKKGLIAKFGRVLKSGGYLLIVTKNPHFFKMRVQDKKLHSKQITIDKLSDLLEVNGFKIKSIFPAVFGKGFHFFPFRELSTRIHNKLLNKSWTLNNPLIKYFSESFLIFTQKK